MRENDSNASRRELRTIVERLFLLNADLHDTDDARLRDLARRAGADCFAEFAALAETLIARYLESGAKQHELRVLSEYFGHLERSAQLLAERGQISSGTALATPDTQSVALVDRHLFSAVDWCRVVSNAAIAKPLTMAVDASQRRNRLVSTVVEPMFLILQALDAEAAVAWELALLERSRGTLDPDVVRELLAAWMHCDTLPKQALHWAQLWSADENLAVQWPELVRRADRLLRRHALRAWAASRRDRRATLEHLSLLAHKFPTDDMRHLRWIEAAIDEMGASVMFFVSLQTEATDAERDAWRANALRREIHAVEALHTPVLLLADVILAEPGGAFRFAKTFFGLVGNGLPDWESKLERQAQNAVRRAFLRGLKHNVSPEHMIQRLTFGDRHVCGKLLGELDWLSKNFDSLRQREIVVRSLAVFYASFREPELLATEISRRYRNLMRVVHEDNLRHTLGPELFAEVEQHQVLRELAALASDARRFISRRRALKTSVEEMNAAELDFVRSVRRRRMTLVRQLLSR